MNAHNYCFEHKAGWSTAAHPEVVIHGEYIGPDGKERAIVSVNHTKRCRYTFHDLVVSKDKVGRRYLRIRDKATDYVASVMLSDATYGVHDFTNHKETAMRFAMAAAETALS